MLSTGRQAALIQQVQDAASSSGRWHGLPAEQVWSLWTRYACTAFYSHPWSWNEIGFGGPAYPRGYKNRHAGGREPWEYADADDSDPVAFTRRVNAAHDSKTRLLAGDSRRES